MMKTLTEQLNTIKFLSNYKPGIILSEQGEFTPEFRRRVGMGGEIFDRIINEPENQPSEFSDEFDYSSSIIDQIYEELINSLGDDSFLEKNEDDVKDYLMDAYSDYLIDRYFS